MVSRPKDALNSGFSLKADFGRQFRMADLVHIWCEMEIMILRIKEKIPMAQGGKVTRLKPQ